MCVNVGAINGETKGRKKADEIHSNCPSASQNHSCNVQAAGPSYLIYLIITF